MKDNQSGSVVVMAIILMAGILVASVEFAIYAVNSLRQARNADRSLVAYYAAESGAESALHQLRKRPLVLDPVSGDPVLNPKTGTTTVAGAPATWLLNTTDTFKSSTDILRTTRLGKYQSITIPLYGNGGDTPLDIESMKVSWKSENNCDAGTTPWIQSRTATWTGGGIQWGDGANKLKNVKEYVKTPTNIAALREVLFNDVITDPSELFGQNLPMVVQVTSMYCDLYGVNISFYDHANATGVNVPMSNMYTIAPQGDYQGVRQQLHLTLPAQAGLSSLFNYVLFSEKAVQK